LLDSLLQETIFKMSLEEVFMNELLADSVIKHLSLSDVKNAALVSRSWRNRIERRQYWRRATLRIRDEAIFSSPRIQSVRRFKLDSSDTDTELVNLFFSFISDNDDYDVEFLMCDNLTLTTVPTQLATSLCKIAVVVELNETKLSKRHHYLFRAISQSSHLKLRKLVLYELLLDEVDPETLACAVTKVEELTLTGVQLLNTYEAIFRVLSQSKQKLKKLIIQSTCEIMKWLRDVDSMAQAMCMVQEVELNLCDLTTDQLEEIFRNISTTSELHLQTLTINFDCWSGSDLSGVSPEILASAVCRLKRCTLSSSEMTSEQLEELCRAIVISKNLPLSYLNIRNTSELEDVKTDILASAVVRLEVVDMVYNSTDAQLHAILSKVVECTYSKLKELYVEHVVWDEPETRSLLVKVKDKMKIFEEGDCWASVYSPKQVIV